MSEDLGFPPGTLPRIITGLSPTIPPWEAFSPDGRSSAVLVLFIPPPLGMPPPLAHIVLMRRSVFVRSHRYQIALPGGRRETRDQSPWDTAVREAAEEIGAPTDRISPLGFLPPVVALDGSRVVPVAGLGMMSLNEMQPAPLEVSRIFSYPWKDFARDQGILFDMKLLGISRKSRVFSKNEDLIWGLTAQVLHAADLQ